MRRREKQTSLVSFFFRSALLPKIAVGARLADGTRIVEPNGSFRRFLGADDRESRVLPAPVYRYTYVSRNVVIKRLKLDGKALESLSFIRESGSFAIVALGESRNGARSRNPLSMTGAKRGNAARVSYTPKAERRERTYGGAQMRARRG